MGTKRSTEAVTKDIPFCKFLAFLTVDGKKFKISLVQKEFLRAFEAKEIVKG